MVCETMADLHIFIWSQIHAKISSALHHKYVIWMMGEDPSAGAGSNALWTFLRYVALTGKRIPTSV